jgi:hypothetical protein
MKTPNYFAPLLALAAHINNQHEHPVQAVVQLPFFQQFTPPAPSQEVAVAAHLVAMNSAALLLANATDMAANTMLRLAATSVEQGLRGLLVGIGCPNMALPKVLAEAGRLVVRNAFPRPLACYAAGAVGDMAVHRLPLAHYEASLHIASEDIAAQTMLHRALRQARTRHAINERNALPVGAGQSQTNWTKEQWQQLTWKLGYTSVFNLVLLAPLRAPLDSSAAPAELHAALTTIVSYCQQVFTAYLAPSLAYAVTGEAFPVTPGQLAA